MCLQLLLFQERNTNRLEVTTVHPAAKWYDLKTVIRTYFAFFMRSFSESG